MKILYVGNYAPMESPLGYCPNALYIERTFRELGYNIRGVNEADLEPEEIISLLDKKKYDLLLTEEGRLRNDFKNDEEGGNDILLGKFAPVLDFARKEGIPVVAWLTNIFFGVLRREIQVITNPIFKADVVFGTDGGHDKEFKKAKVNYRLLRQGIYQKEAYLGKPIFPTKAEIVFVGAVYEHIWPYRKRLIDFLTLTYGTKFEQL